ncbi:MAG: glutamate synthase large subunit [Vicinamibacterales bacterium]|nr:glutamate synthase large subunit [Vicinamibacterales bacterium]
MGDPDQPLTPTTEPVYADHDACGVGFVADLGGRADHEWLQRALDALRRLTHRGAPSDGRGSADGAGVLTAIPWTLLARDLPSAFGAAEGGRMAGMCFIPPAAVAAAQATIDAALEQEGWRFLTWRHVPVDRTCLGEAEAASEPAIYQVLGLHGASPALDEAALDASLYRARLRAEARLLAQGLGAVAITSLSLRTIVYKALVTPADLPRYYPDLDDPAYETAFAVFHQRFSTNTFPQWRLAQPFRVLAHNGEINTVLGNRLGAARRQADRACLPDLPDGIGPLVRASGSDSESLDDAVDAMRQAGFSLAHAFARLIPRAWEHDPDVPAAEQAFERYQACFTEPWEGPGGLAFADGRQVGAMLDRNGFRPARVIVTTTGQVCVGSETGIFDVTESEVRQRSRLGPGEMAIVDFASGELRDNRGVRQALAAAQPYRTWVDLAVAPVQPSPETAPTVRDEADLRRQQRIFGYTAEELELILRPMVDEGKEAVGSMGDDTPLAIFTPRRRVLTDFFRQRFAQVTNPPLDPLRESVVMSLETCFGRQGRLLAESPVEARMVLAPTPILTEALRDGLRQLPQRPVAIVSTTYAIGGGEDGFREGLARVAREAVDAVRDGAVVVMLSDRQASSTEAPLPSLLAVTAAGRALTEAGLGGRAGLVADTGEVRDAHQAAALLAFGAAAVCPWLAIETARALAVKTGMAPDEAERQWREAVEQGLLKVLSKMGVCTIAGYRGGQLFEAVGLAPSLVERYFPGTPVVPGALTIDALAAQEVAAHQAACGTSAAQLPHPGFHVFRRDGDHHAYNPALVREFHKALDAGHEDAYRGFAALVHGRPATAVRDLFEFRSGPAIPIEEVEPAERIVSRFFASAMSVGALGPEAHATLAMAMNRVGGRSNSGEGGEDPARFARPLTGDWANSTTKQVASARFGVTPHYLISATELQIKMAQGSKPGEGGQLPAAKVVDHIARLRHAQPHTSLISPPPHHDIYSIEDLAQLIYDLRSFNPTARMNVKLVSTSGVGVIAAGVVKAGADAIQISGHDGGTGASPRGSIKHAGLPWEIGLLDAHRVLTARGARHRVILQTDGGLKTGHDVAMAAAFGAQEYGFGTALLVALGCVMARQCHQNTCPVGIATQRPDLRAKYAGTVDHVVHYLHLMAGEVRGILASLGLRSLDALVGRVDLLEPRNRAEAGRLTLDGMAAPMTSGELHEVAEDPALMPAGAFTMNGRIAARVRRGLGQHAIEIEEAIRNTDRTVGATLSGLIAARFGNLGVPHAPVRLSLTGTAGQSLGAFNVPGVEIHLTGDANDGVGKGMHGGTIAIAPPPRPTRLDSQVLIGNAALYGATGGRLFVAGQAGERFAVRNSGAVAVIEGVGHHGCEYMTGGLVVVLGSTGLNFGAGMTGGLAYVLDRDARLAGRLNHELVTLGALDAADEEALLSWIVEHRAETGSAVAAHLLHHWATERRAFRKVAPTGLSIAAPVAPERREQMRA